MNMRMASILVVLGLTVPVLAAPLQERALTFEQRVAAQHAIEQVYWSHRIWPESNPGPKPPLSSVLPDGAIRAKVATYLEESNALDRVWRRPISASQLQAELDRMARSTRAPDVLRELWAALGNDAQLIAETLGRQTLTDRLARGWYAFDERLHGDVKRRAERALESCADAACMRTMGGRYTETTWMRRTVAGPAHANDENGHRIVFLDAEQWKTYRERWAGGLEDSSDTHPRTTLGRLEETEEGFSVSAVLSESAEALTTASVVWDKQPFDAWWRSVRGEFGTTIESPRGEYAITAPATGECNINTWSKIPNGVEPRYGQTAVWTGTEMIVWGGYGDGGDGRDSGGRYNPDTDTWIPTSQEPNTPRARFAHTAVWTGTEMIVWGGGTNQGLLNSGGRYDPTSDSWKPTSIGTDVPLARHHHVAVWTGSRMIVWGGQNPYTGNGYLNNGGLYNPSSDTWKPTSVGAGVPLRRAYHAAVWTGSEMIVWGGADDTPNSMNSGGRYDPSSDVWHPTSISAATPSGVSSPTAVWTGTQMIVWGGGGSSLPPTGFSNQGGRYDPSTDTWLPTSTGARVPQGRADHTAVWTGSEMIVWGGEDRWTQTFFDSGGRYDPISDTWIATSSNANTPSGRAHPTAVWTGTEMIVWGGQGAESTFNSGGRYSPSTDSWVATAIPGDAPAERTRHTAVWTGTEMIVWGGQFSDASALRTGGRYTPATGTWRPTPIGGSTPSARYDHTAVWTGTEMIVWGGDDGSRLLDSGGRYDPSSNTWHATSQNATAPTPRTGHAAVWTGTEMIVWGGDNGVSLLSTGGRYAPASNSWTATTVAGAPSGRKGATAVWTGSEMIAWGGQGSGLENSGGRYDPSDNSWRATSLGAGVPSGRVGHTAVWTGTRMIVWGGNAGVYGTMENTGGRYDPAGDSWVPTTISGSPAGRTDHTAVWTGNEMIVWGGADAYTTLNSGGRYIPWSDSWLRTSTGAPLPVSRTLQSAIWTGRAMIVWGGNRTTASGPPYPYLTATGGAYCADSCASPATLYRDADGDGYGNPHDSQMTCANPPGWVALAGDCDDSNPSVHLGAPEVCNGLDDDCDTAIDEGIPVPSESPILTESKYGATVSLFWTEVQDATGYDVIVGDLTLLHASGGNFTSSTTGCIENDVASLSTLTLGFDPPGGSWYLVRAVNPCSGNGSYDDGHQQGSRDAEIAASAPACP